MAVAERTDEQKLSMAPIEVQFGGKSYKLPVRRILKARAWREEFIKSISDIASELQGNVASLDNFVGGFAFAFLRFPEKLADLVFAYAPDLDRKLIEDEATEEELTLAFSSIMQVAFPFASALSMAMQVMKTAAIPSPSARPTN